MQEPKTERDYIIDKLAGRLPIYVKKSHYPEHMWTPLHDTSMPLCERIRHIKKYTTDVELRIETPEEYLQRHNNKSTTERE